MEIFCLKILRLASVVWNGTSWRKFWFCFGDLRSGSSRIRSRDHFSVHPTDVCPNLGRDMQSDPIGKKWQNPIVSFLRARYRKSQPTTNQMPDSSGPLRWAEFPRREKFPYFREHFTFPSGQEILSKGSTEVVGNVRYVMIKKSPILSEFAKKLTFARTFWGGDRIC